MPKNGPNIWLAKPPNSRYWVIRYEDPDSGHTRQKSTATAKKKEAERILGEFRADLLNKRYHGPNNVGWAAFRDKYEAEVLSGLAKGTMHKVDTVFDAIEEVLHPQKLSDLTAARISKFVAEIRDGERSESTIAGYLAHLRAALSWAVNMGMLPAVPKIQKLKRAKVYKKSKGRAPTEEEFKKILKIVPSVVGEESATSWRHFLEGLWWSGLRLSEALQLSWDRYEKLRVDFHSGQPLLKIPAELEKGHQDRLLPIAPEFVEFLLKTPTERRKGPKAQRVCGDRMRLDSVSKVISEIGEKAKVVVHVDARTKKAKYASAHDFRRAFGDRWALRVMPPILMQLMRHESIDTTMRFYVGRSVEATTEVLCAAYRNNSSPEERKPGANRESRQERDTLRDTGPKSPQNDQEPPDVSSTPGGS
jgi:integrase